MKNYKSLMAFILLCLIWSSTWLVIKIGLQTMPPFFSAGVRFVIAALTLYLFSLKLKLKFPVNFEDHKFFLYFSFGIFAIPYGLVYWAEQYINSGLTSVLFSVMPFFTAILAIKFLPSEKITFKKVSGIIIGISGVIIIFFDQLKLDHPLALYGMIGVLISPVFSAYGTIVGKKVSAKYHPIILNVLPLLYSGILFLIISLASETISVLDLTRTSYFSIFYLAFFGTALAFVIYFWMLNHTSALIMSSITFITPPLALIWGWLMLEEQISWNLIVGMVVIFCGIYFLGDKVKKVKNLP